MLLWRNLKHVVVEVICPLWLCWRWREREEKRWNVEISYSWSPWNSWRTFPCLLGASWSPCVLDNDLWVYETGQQNLDGSVGIFYFILCLKGLFGALKDAMRFSRALHNVWMCRSDIIRLENDPLMNPRKTSWSWTGCSMEAATCLTNCFCWSRDFPGALYSGRDGFDYLSWREN